MKTSPTPLTHPFGRPGFLAASPTTRRCAEVQPNIHFLLSQILFELAVDESFFPFLTIVYLQILVLFVPFLSLTLLQ